VFGAAFRHAMRHELFATNPIANVRQVRKRAVEPEILEPAETLTILGSCGVTSALIVQLCTFGAPLSMV